MVYDTLFHMATLCKDGTFVVPDKWSIGSFTANLIIIYYSLPKYGHVHVKYSVSSDISEVSITNPCYIQYQQRYFEILQWNTQMTARPVNLKQIFLFQKRHYISSELLNELDGQRMLTLYYFPYYKMVSNCLVGVSINPESEIMMMHAQVQLAPLVGEICPYRSKPDLSTLRVKRGNALASVVRLTFLSQNTVQLCTIQLWIII